MIVLDTTVLIYAVGGEHRLREPCRSLIGAVGEGRIDATTTVGVIHEFVHVRARKKGRQDAAFTGREYAELLSPLLTLTEGDLAGGLRLFETVDQLDSFDAVLAAAAMERNVEALISADSAFGAVPGLRHIDPGSPEMGSFLLQPR